MNSLPPNNIVARSKLQVQKSLDDLLEKEILPGLGLDTQSIWEGFSDLVHQLTPVNNELLQKRVKLQSQIDNWHKESPNGVQTKFSEYKNFLMEIGYLVEEGPDFVVETENSDAEIAHIAGPQLVVPVNNARFALNAANARWGSLFDALYGTDAIAEEAGLERAGTFNEKRGKKVIAEAMAFLDKALPLAGGISHANIVQYTVTVEGQPKLYMQAANGSKAALKNAHKFVGYQKQAGSCVLLFKNNGLHIELHVDPTHPIGALNPVGIKDVVLESALSTIQDCEDSVAAVDTQDKVQVYRNWLGLMKGDLTETFKKNGKSLTRKLQPDRIYNSVDGGELKLKGRSLLLVRNVGHLMKTDAVLDETGEPISEGFLDAFITTLCAMHDFSENTPLHNSRTGSIYIVKPKMHGPEEAALANELFRRIEDILGLARRTIKIGLMDEERRTTVNLKECIRAIKGRVFFINTGFLDRTGDEIHTSMQAGAVYPKDNIKGEPWLSAYEDWNVDIGLKCGLPGKAQIGKGMWAKPDGMAEMLATKQGHLQAGANCAWVPSPTAATLHATHYHEVDVFEVQSELKNRPIANLDDILTPPLMKGENLSEEEIRREIENNAQGILGYVVRWIDQGVGCSKVPDINDVGLMEDRATLRISSQHIANWLVHGICSEEEVMDVMKRMAVVVDGQNSGDPAYKPMAPNFNGIAFKSACALVFEGATQPSGYTEPLLHAYRIEQKMS